MKLVIWLVIPVFLCYAVLAGVVVNEVMYDYEGTDSGHEWVEVYSDESVNFSGWKFYENNVNHGLSLVNGSWVFSGYAVIADNAGVFLQDYPNFSGVVFDSAFSLSNNGEIVGLRDSYGNLTCQINYNVTLGGDGNAKSIGIFNNTWREVIASPGKENNVSFVYEEDNVTVHEEENSSFQAEEENVSVGGCNVSISVSAEKLFYQNKEKVKYWIELSNEDADFVIEYWIDDLNGENVKKAYSSSNTNRRSWTPSIDESLEVVLIKARIVELDCDDLDDGDNYAETMIVINGTKKEVEEIVCESEKETENKTKSPAYVLLEAPGKIVAGERFDVKVRISNNDDEEHDYEVWSYVYRGSKSYSGEREANAVVETVDAGGQKDAVLQVLVDEGTAVGGYNLMVKIRKDEQKTVKNLKQAVNVTDEEAGNSSEEANNTCVCNCNTTLLPELKKADSKISTYAAKTPECKCDTVAKSALMPYRERMVYESPSAKAEKLIMPFLVILLGVFCIVLLYYK